jgi:hypothetical protein
MGSDMIPQGRYPVLSMVLQLTKKTTGDGSNKAHIMPSVEWEYGRE